MPTTLTVFLPATGNGMLQLIRDSLKAVY